MRQHLVQCFKGGLLNHFPERSCKRVIKVARQEKLLIHCICRLPYKGEIMVQCEKCKKCFQPKIPKKYLSKDCKDHYYCLLNHTLRW